MITAERPSSATGLLIAWLFVGAAVAVTLGVYGRVHDQEVGAIFSGDPNPAKSALATVAILLVAFQLYSALRMWGKVQFPRSLPGWWGDAHRLSGTVAFVVSLPVAFNCLVSYGYVLNDSFRVTLHGTLGCMVYGAFAAKVLVVRSDRMPGWALPAVGGLLFAAFTLVWATSAFVFYFAKGSL